MVCFINIERVRAKKHYRNIIDESEGLLPDLKGRQNPKSSLIHYQPFFWWFLSFATKW